MADPTAIALVRSLMHEDAATVDAARDLAWLGLIDALTCGLQALRHPGCTNQLGPVVPGATMAGGARVPGTSYDLDPVQAACNIGTMIHWLAANDASLAAGGSHPSHCLGAVLATADYLSRKAHAEAANSLTVRELLDALRRAQALEAQVVSQAVSDAMDPAVAIRVASAAVVTAMLGGSNPQVARAIELATDAGGLTSFRASTADRACVLGDAAGRAVRLALRAMSEPAAELRAAVEADPAPSAMVPPLVAPDSTLDAATRMRIGERFEAAVIAHFPVRQAGRIRDLFSEPMRAKSLPVNELMAVLVKN